MSGSHWQKVRVSLVLVIALLLAIQGSPIHRATITSDGDSIQEKPYKQAHKLEVISLAKRGFERLPDKLPRSSDIAGVYHLNRYSDIIPTPETIVTLRRDTGSKIDNYINANFVNGKDYIATQGPLPATISDFWRMVWEQDVSVIVMVTGIREGGRIKCERYWPEDVGTKFQVLTKDGSRITMLSTDEHNRDRSEPYVRSELLLEQAGHSRIVYHFWYNTWPDMDVPVDANGQVEWQGAANMLRTIHAEGRKGPWVVHCSAGIGRTGTFIGIDMGQRLLERDGKVDVLELIRTMRDARGGMVQTYSQAQFMQAALRGFADQHNKCFHEAC